MIKSKSLYITLILTAMLATALYATPQSKEVDAVLDKARYYIDHLNYDSSILYLDSAMALTRSTNDRLNVTYINRLKGYAYLKKNQYDSAGFYLEKARKQAKLLGNDTILATAELNLGWVKHQNGLSDSALILYKNGLKIYQSTGDTSGMATAYTFLAYHYNYSGDFDKALNNALKATYIYSKKDEPKRYIKSLIQLGNSYENLKDNDTAIACFKKAYQLSLDHNFPKEATSALINIAVVHYNWGKDLEEKKDSAKAREEFNLTKDYFLKAIEFNDSLNNKKQLALVYANISTIYRRLNEDQKAIESAQKSIDLAIEINNPGVQLRALNNLGICYKKLKDYSRAESCYLEAMALAKKLHYMAELLNLTNNLSNIYEIKGDYKESLKYARLAAAYQDSLFSEKKQELIEKHKADFEILHLKDQNKIKELEKKKIRFQRNLSYVIGAVIILLLILILYFFRMRARKNRIIAAQKIQKLEDEKRLMAAQSVLVGQEKERERIARELHDGIGVLLSTASIHFSSVEEQTDEETGKMLKKANKLLKDASKEVRQISHNMMPGVLSKFGLREAIEDLFEDVEDTGDLDIDLQVKCKKERLPENTEIMIYRVIQEMLNNTLKHANASAISLFVERTDEQIIIEYADNGDGFVTDKIPQNKSLGLSGIRSRIDYLGGHIELTSKQGKGTRYSITIPIINKKE